ncbi:hypothetical protein F511_16374 [Dorcoceras hygrometricum]|uniref:Uncharacterized protein n=1 Tax=Dorcoceras hygrometricum TaxID=472368 RepID=A0A2Z7AJX9_9LAMI|nr:hypothetical protein F511_16374 [Dorcoceras hygrometricum]
MLFYLTTLNLVRFLREDAPTVTENETDKDKRVAFKAWGHGDFLCRNYVLNGLVNSLYNVYSPMKTVKLLWESLEKKYKTEGAGLKLQPTLALRLNFKIQPVACYSSVDPH